MTWRHLSEGFDIRHWPWWMNASFFALWGIAIGYAIWGAP